VFSAAHLTGSRFKKILMEFESRCASKSKLLSISWFIELRLVHSHDTVILATHSDCSLNTQYNLSIMRFDACTKIKFINVIEFELNS